MKLLHLYIEKYKKYEKQHIFFSKDTSSCYQNELFNSMQITLFAGENGSGKTTILSFIAKIFRYIQRFRDRIPCDFSLAYTIETDGKEHSIILEKIESNITISIDTILYHLMKYDIRTKSYKYDLSIYDKQITYDEIKPYLPANVLVLGFDVDYDRISYSHNYYGDRLVNFRSIDSAYTTSAIGSDFSLGILNTILQSTQNLELQNIFKCMGFEFAPFVDVYFNFTSDDWNSDLNKSKIEKKYFYEEYWKHYIDKEVGMNSRINLSIFFREQKNIDILSYFINHNYIYINEFYIVKNFSYIPISGMSTGEKSFLYHLFFIVDKIRNNSLIIWEEPETHLNQLWSRQLIPLLTYMFRKYNVHFLLSSHEITLINCLFPNQIILLNSTDIKYPDFQTFLANENEIIFKLYKPKVYNPFEEYIIEKINSCNKDDLKELLNNIAESFLKFLIYQQINK